MPTTLYVSDLDGTLLGPDAAVSARTVEVVGEFVAAGGLFTYATARSFISASKVTAGLRLELPVITYGGAIIVDPRSGQPRPPVLLPAAVVVAVQAESLVPDAVQPILFARHGGRERLCWLAGRATPAVEGFLARRRGDPRLMPLTSWDEIDPGSVFYLSVLGERAPVAALRERLTPVLVGCHVVFGEDVYVPGEYWLELSAAAATKARAIEAVRAEVGADRLVCFGDNQNDLSMFAIADESLAVANAVPDVLAAATGVIGSNAESGVAEWLSANALRDDLR